MKNVIILFLSVYILYNMENKKSETHNYFYLDKLSITDTIYKNLSGIENINEGKNIKEVEGKVITPPFICPSPQKE